MDSVEVYHRLSKWDTILLEIQKSVPINVISLAGMAFAIGMVVDASIVSLENIFRLRQKGMDAPTAAYRGARQVWAPILGSFRTFAPLSSASRRYSCILW